MIQPSGHIFFVDEWTQQYVVDWRTVGTNIDITSEIRQPYIWGEEPQGYVDNHIVYRYGMITIHRQILKPLSNGYEIIAEGVSFYEDYIQMNFPCGGGPTDPFVYHLDCALLDVPYFKVLIGPHWADPDDPDDDTAVWGDLDITGAPVTLTAGLQPLEWIDVWSL